MLDKSEHDLGPAVPSTRVTAEEHEVHEDHVPSDVDNRASSSTSPPRRRGLISESRSTRVVATIATLLFAGFGVFAVAEGVQWGNYALAGAGLLATIPLFVVALSLLPKKIAFLSTVVIIASAGAYVAYASGSLIEWSGTYTGVVRPSGQPGSIMIVSDPSGNARGALILSAPDLKGGRCTVNLTRDMRHIRAIGGQACVSTSAEVSDDGPDYAVDWVSLNIEGDQISAAVEMIDKGPWAIPRESCAEWNYKSGSCHPTLDFVGSRSPGAAPHLPPLLFTAPSASVAAPAPTTASPPSPASAAVNSLPRIATTGTVALGSDVPTFEGHISATERGDDFLTFVDDHKWHVVLLDVSTDDPEQGGAHSEPFMYIGGDLAGMEYDIQPNPSMPDAKVVCERGACKLRGYFSIGATSGPHQGILSVALKPVRTEDVR